MALLISMSFRASWVRIRLSIRSHKAEAMLWFNVGQQNFKLQILIIIVVITLMLSWVP